MRGSFSEVIEVCGGLLLMGWIELVVYHGAEKPLFDSSGHLKRAPSTCDPTCWSPLGSVRMCGNVEFIARDLSQLPGFEQPICLRYIPQQKFELTGILESMRYHFADATIT